MRAAVMSQKVTSSHCPVMRDALAIACKLYGEMATLAGFLIKMAPKLGNAMLFGNMVQEGGLSITPPLPVLGITVMDGVLKI